MLNNLCIVLCHLFSILKHNCSIVASHALEPVSVIPYHSFLSYSFPPVHLFFIASQCWVSHKRAAWHSQETKAVVGASPCSSLQPDAAYSQLPTKGDQSASLPGEPMGIAWQIPQLITGQRAHAKGILHRHCCWRLSPFEPRRLAPPPAGWYFHPAAPRLKPVWALKLLESWGLGASHRHLPPGNPLLPRLGSTETSPPSRPQVYSPALKRKLQEASVSLFGKFFRA